MKKLNTSFTRTRFWNPLILPKETHTPEIRDGWRDEDKASVEIARRFLASWKEKIPAGVKKCGQYAVPALDFPQADKPQWGFSNTSGMIPNLFWMDPKKDMAKSFAYWWPRSCTSAKPMRWAMSVNLGPWHWLLSRITSYRHNEWTEMSPYGVVKNTDSEPDDTWFHLFVGLQSEFDNFVPDCTVVVQHVKAYDRGRVMSFEKDVRAEGFLGEALDLFRDYQGRSEYDGEVSFNAPCDFLGEPVLRFQKDALDGFNGPDDDAEETTGEVQVFGRPQSQQEPRRFISPNHLAMSACIPAISCSDPKHDMTHQVYMDTWGMSDFDFCRMYCKMDSSCT